MEHIADLFFKDIDVYNEKVGTDIAVRRIRALKYLRFTPTEDAGGKPGVFIEEKALPNATAILGKFYRVSVLLCRLGGFSKQPGRF